MKEVFGITGTNGKTTTSYMLAEILKKKGEECAVIGTVAHKIGDSSYPALNTTPGKDMLRKYMLEAGEKGIQTMILEVSSHGLEQGRTDEVPIKHAAFMNLSQDHMDYHKNMESYYLAKRKLFDFKTLTSAIINIDDNYGARLLHELQINRPELKLASVSLEDENADFFAKVKKQSFSGTEFEIFVRLYGCAEKESTLLKIKTPGKHNVYDAVIATALAFCAAEHTCREDAYSELMTAKKALACFEGADGRFQILTGKKDGVFAICDYAHTPDALEKLIATVKELKKEDECTRNGRVITVFGCGGDRDVEKRPIMGKTAGVLSDYTVITSDNPRSEDPLDIINDIEKGIYGTYADYCIIADRKSAIEHAVNIARKGDIVVVAGKGHETYQIIGNVKKHFDDREIIRGIL